MYYFGTDLQQAGHYFWDLNGQRMDRSDVYFKDIPFDPYDGQQRLPKGTVKYYLINGPVFQYSVIVISGSCTDDRYGTVSTFFVKRNLPESELKELILSTPIAKKIIEQMPFQVKWNEDKNIA